MLYLAFVTDLATMYLHASQNAPVGTNNIIMMAKVSADTVGAQQQSAQQHQDQTRRNLRMQTQSPSEYPRTYNQTLLTSTLTPISATSPSTTSPTSVNSVTLLDTDKQGKTYVPPDTDIQLPHHRH